MHGAITCSEPNARQVGRSRSTAQATRSSGPNLNIALNKRISSIDSMQELCELIHARSTQFDHVNVATAFRRVLQMPRCGDSQDTHYKPIENLLLALEQRAEAISGEFNSQHIANTLWAFATLGRKPGERMIGQMEGRAEAISWAGV